MPEVDAEAPASSWVLGGTGRHQAELLAERLTGLSPGVIWSSREPKAVETAEIVADCLGLPVRVADGLEEHHRAGVPFFPTQREFESAVERMFREPDELVFGSETGSEALGRFSAAVYRIIEGVESDAVVVTHGTVMALYVAKVAHVEPMDFWRRLGLPSFVVLTLPEMRVIEVVEGLGSEQAPNSGRRSGGHVKEWDWQDSTR